MIPSSDGSSYHNTAVTHLPHQPLPQDSVSLPCKSSRTRGTAGSKSSPKIGRCFSTKGYYANGVIVSVVLCVTCVMTYGVVSIV